MSGLKLHRRPLANKRRYLDSLGIDAIAYTQTV